MHPTMTIKEKVPPSFVTGEARWAAVLRRDRHADDVFFYSVQTTGIYCRPSCPSRQARRDHVQFYPTVAAAEQAGFRPCRRCRPNEPALSQQHSAAVARACHLIEISDEMLSLDGLAQAAGMSGSHFHRVFKRVTGVTPKAYAAQHRAQRVRDELARSQSVTDAIYGAGFSSSGRFYAEALQTLGMTPTKFRTGGKGELIRFAVGECSLGAILVAATDKGICAVMLDDDPEQLLRELQDRFSKAQLIGGDPDFEHWVAKVIGLVERPALGLELPPDVRGTAFQRRVWQALRAIPIGETASYTEIAARIGAPKAVRAVAQACGSNPIAVAIPCHRVVRNDGALSGYRWGIERKRALLEREAS
ncbi:MAG: bifunctional DNA-binding transcriptional regulator/O6-methylguanine-DNA methyltransferase Ada [Pseudomonadota bacterium]|nr:bifunctional DNA-binding transcriptional regulator/O6-methylguanine-DNA methyltransferase Ada [Pseudomonadota bacterium]